MRSTLCQAFLSEVVIGFSLGHFGLWRNFKFVEFQSPVKLAHVHLLEILVHSIQVSQEYQQTNPNWTKE